MLDKKNMPNTHGAGIISAIRRGQIKDIAHKKCMGIHSTGSFQPCSRAMKGYLYWHEPACKQLIEAFENNWSMDDRLTAETAMEVCMTRNANIEIEEALHMVIGTFLAGGARVLAETVEPMMPNGGGSRKSGL